MRWTTLLVAVSTAELESGIAAGIRPGQRIVVANGVDVSRFGKSDRHTVREALGLPSVPLVVCLGRLAQQKGQDILLAAWPDIVRAVADARLIFVGDGPTRGELQSSAPSGVEFVGNSTTPEMWYTAADVVVVPSRWEGMPLVPLEAMASARSVVAFDVDGVAEAVADAGAVVPAGDVQALIMATIDRLRDPGTAAREGLAGQARVSRLFTIDSCTRRLSEAAMALVDDSARVSM
jgi:glycosyltransferase involved in cell wall biosynthesis